MAANFHILLIEDDSGDRLIADVVVLGRNVVIFQKSGKP